MSSTLTTAGDPDDLDLDYTRAMRRKLVEHMTKGGMPTETKEMSVMLQALDGMDRASLSKKKIKSDEGISNTKALAAETIAQLFTDPRLKRMGLGDGTVTTVVPVLREMSAPALVAGELDLIGGLENYDSFMKKYMPAEDAKAD